MLASRHEGEGVSMPPAHGQREAAFSKHDQKHPGGATKSGEILVATGGRCPNDNRRGQASGDRSRAQTGGKEKPGRSQWPQLQDEGGSEGRRTKR